MKSGEVNVTGYTTSSNNILLNLILSLYMKVSCLKLKCKAIVQNQLSMIGYHMNVFFSRGAIFTDFSVICENLNCKPHVSNV